MTFKKWFDGTPKVFQDKVLLYINPSLTQLEMIVGTSIYDQMTIDAVNAKMSMLKMMYNSGEFGEPERGL